MSSTVRSKLALSISAALSTYALSIPVFAEEAEKTEDAVEAITVVGRSVSYANNQTTDSMMKQQTSMTSVLATIDNLPGVLINEGDAFGADDWSTSISIRGFQVDVNQQQIGMTVDGIANGGSNYGGGAKANRYIDTENLGRVEVSQGTADIASRSHEALGGTLNFTTLMPTVDERLVVSTTFAEFGGKKLFLRYEAGEIAKDTFAWFSMANQESSDWMGQTAENVRDHFAAKVVSTVNNVDLTAYVSYDDTHEDNYQRIYSLGQFAQNSTWDGLTTEWTGIPYQDQNYRRGWSTLRENFFTYLKADFEVGDVLFSGNVYYHKNEGRGDWMPQYIADVNDDGAGNGHSELVSGNTVLGGAVLGQLLFVNRNGESVAPIDGCVSSITFPYGGAGPEFDPGCYENGAIPVSSYRNTNYKKSRVGINGDFIWDAQIADMDNTLRGGFWYEDVTREETRSWHKIMNSQISYDYDETPYWIQYDREFPVETMMFYLEDQLDLGFAKVTAGLKQFNVDVAKNDRYVSANDKSVTSDSDLLISAGFVAPLPIDNVEVFAGFAQNYAAIKDTVLERDDADLSVIKPETADNFDMGLRYSTRELSASLTYYVTKYDDRITFISNETVDGIDYFEAAAGGYVNEGGIESKGFEASVTYQLSEQFSVYASYTSNDSEYTDVALLGNTVVGAAEQMGVVSFDWQRGNHSAGLSTKYVGERFMDQANTNVVEAYTVSDLYFSTHIDDLGSSVESVEINFTINNVFDESYLGTVVPGGAWIGAPRTAAINLKAAF
ncbi:TonB-dependent receptor [uncultured Paraglaciecola sp.]|uniref:TonB-dependent receptor domain-containing protein n=1 Tax=uncultured Paraglaciecola sp. TaxID=1765024 RepID=UPI00262B95F5|nr:TonB-dependent receptor [uncultured Paraglaciecola sp.]